MKNKIEEFLKSNETELSLPFIPLEIYETLFNELGYENYAKDTNGWELDFWWKYKKDSDIITLEGSLYSGEFKLIKQ